MWNAWTPRRSDQLITQEIEDELLVFSPSNNQAHCLPREVVQVWHLCDGESTVADIFLSLKNDQLPWTLNRVKAAVIDLVDKSLLKKNDGPANQLPRRTLLKGAALLPVIASVMVPEPAAAMSNCVEGSGFPNGCGNIANMGQLCRSGGAGDCVDCRCATHRYTSGTSCDTDQITAFTCVDTSIPPLSGIVMASCAMARIAATTQTTTYTHCLGFLAQTNNAPPGLSAYVCWEC